MVASGRSIVEVSSALRIGENLIYRWKNQQRDASLDKTKEKRSGCMAGSGPTAEKTSADGNGAGYCGADAALVAGPKSLSHFQPNNLTMLYSFIQQMESQFPAHLTYTSHFGR